MNNLLPDGSIADPFKNYIALSRYARWLEDDGRREVWSETVDRYLSYMTNKLSEEFDYSPDSSMVEKIRQSIYNLELVPSMRALMTAGPALDRSNIAGFNCSYLPLQDRRAFSELLYILMNGTGVGYSVEKQYVDQLPYVPAINLREIYTVVVEDSKEGWAIAFDEVLRYLWAGYTVEWDLSKVRAEGERLKVFGGRASGPEPLEKLFKFTKNIFMNARGRKLKPIEVHDIACMTAKCIVSGGVRRSAMISLSDLDDVEMANAKTGEWWVENDHRALANNSAVYFDGMGLEAFHKEWDSIVASGSGERGIFNRDAARRQAAKVGRDPNADYGTNPCSEIILKPFSFCNLSEVIVKPEDTVKDVMAKAYYAAILGTWQSTLTKFPFIREEFQENAEEERLLGVSLTGVFGNENLNNIHEDLVKNLTLLRSAAREGNAQEADRLGIELADAITCVKPSGTVSQLAQVSSGLHPWHSEQYIRTIRESKSNPLAKLMKDNGVPCEEDLMNDTNYVFSFPVKAPTGSVTRDKLTAIDHLEMWLIYQRHYCEHKPSVTISVKEDEWEDVGRWVWEHIGELSGVSFLPFSEHTYNQAPYQECSIEKYLEAKAKFPEVHWGDLSFYEMEDETEGSQELACTSGACDLK